jgi:hypothetical protein
MRRRYYPFYKEISETTLELLADVFNRQFAFRRSLIEAKKLLKTENIDLTIAFELIDSENKTFINSNDVAHYDEALCIHFKT